MMMMNCENSLELMAASLAKLDVSTLLSSLSPTNSTSNPLADHQRRKRRRGEVANPSNTLDALVARKADEQPFEKRYLSEQEAIEGPDDESEMKKMEMDPDVSTRTCSTCGYQGKWVSEMIRHKRVHTSERPFKCRYCSRTSKWKADLIRHVAKTHGIRVVSKYSRSKVYTSSSSSQHQSHESSPEHETECVLPPCSEPQTPEKRCVTYRCQICNFEDERVSILNLHVANIHQTSPCACRCGMRFEDVQSALSHSSSLTCTNADLIFNVMPSYEKASPLSLSPCRSETSSDSGINTDPEEEMMIPPPPQLKLNLPPFTSCTPLLMSPTLSVPTTPFLPDLQTALLSLQSSPLMSLYLASLLQTSLINNNNNNNNNMDCTNNNSYNSNLIVNTPESVEEDDLVDVEM